MADYTEERNENHIKCLEFQIKELNGTNKTLCNKLQAMNDKEKYSKLTPLNKQPEQINNKFKEVIKKIDGLNLLLINVNSSYNKIVILKRDGLHEMTYRYVKKQIALHQSDIKSLLCSNSRDIAESYGYIIPPDDELIDMDKNLTTKLEFFENEMLKDQLEFKIFEAYEEKFQYIRPLLRNLKNIFTEDNINQIKENMDTIFDELHYFEKEQHLLDELLTNSFNLRKQNRSYMREFSVILDYMHKDETIPIAQNMTPELHYILNFLKNKEEYAPYEEDIFLKFKERNDAMEDRVIKAEKLFTIGKLFIESSYLLVFEKNFNAKSQFDTMYSTWKPVNLPEYI